MLLKIPIAVKRCKSSSREKKDFPSKISRSVKMRIQAAAAAISSNRESALNCDAVFNGPNERGSQLQTTPPGKSSSKWSINLSFGIIDT